MSVSAMQAIPSVIQGLSLSSLLLTAVPAWPAGASEPGGALSIHREVLFVDKDKIAPQPGNWRDPITRIRGEE